MERRAEPKKKMEEGERLKRERLKRDCTVQQDPPAEHSKLVQ